MIFRTSDLFRTNDPSKQRPFETTTLRTNDLPRPNHATFIGETSIFSVPSHILCRYSFWWRSPRDFISHWGCVICWEATPLRHSPRLLSSFAWGRFSFKNLLMVAILCLREGFGWVISSCPRVLRICREARRFENFVRKICVCLSVCLSDRSLSSSEGKELLTFLRNFSKF